MATVGGVFEVARALVMSTAVRLLRAMLRFISTDHVLNGFSAETNSWLNRRSPIRAIRMEPGKRGHDLRMEPGAV